MTPSRINSRQNNRPRTNRSAQPKLLALDTSTRQVGLALYDGIQVLGEFLWTSPDYHTVELAPAVEVLLARTGVAAADLGAVGVALGPGSFTGLRIGLALAKGLALAQNIPLVGIPTLDALAAAHSIQPYPMAAILQAGRGRLAVGWYKSSEGSWAVENCFEVLTPDELIDRIQSPTLVCGELTEDERLLLSRHKKNVKLLSPAASMRRASFLAELAWRRWQAGQLDDPAGLSPIYLHYNEPIPG
jgi:tRNA threonylcarbamoyladenosine biosynthesis protein TsaB